MPVGGSLANAISIQVRFRSRPRDMSMHQQAWHGSLSELRACKLV
jgi:hypothetical protein